MSDASAPERVGRGVVWSSFRMRKEGVDGRRARPLGDVIVRTHDDAGVVIAV